VEWARFEKLGVFPFSAEEGTAACSMPRRPRAATARRRAETLMAAQRDISRKNLQELVGTVLPVIVDRARDGEATSCEARTQWDAPEVDGTVFVRQCGSPPGAIINVRVTEAGDYDVHAEQA
jgi:ribosomal protein S12 methylthiotransferase